MGRSSVQHVGIPYFPPFLGLWYRCCPHNFCPMGQSSSHAPMCLQKNLQKIRYEYEPHHYWSEPTKRSKRLYTLRCIFMCKKCFLLKFQIIFQYCKTGYVFSICSYRYHINAYIVSSCNATTGLSLSH